MKCHCKVCNSLESDDNTRYIMHVSEKGDIMSFEVFNRGTEDEVFYITFSGHITSSVEVLYCPYCGRLRRVNE